MSQKTEPIKIEVINTTETEQQIMLTFSCGGTRFKNIILGINPDIPQPCELRWQDTELKPCTICGCYPRDKKSTCKKT